MIRDDWNGFNVLHTAASRVGGLDCGFVPGEGGLDTDGILDGAASGAIKAVWLHGADEINMEALGDAFVVYQGTHGDRGAHRADVILPGAAHTEKNGIYVNTEGRVQLGRMAVFPIGEGREDWKIHRALSERLGKSLPFDSLQDVRMALAIAAPVFQEIDVCHANPWGEFGADGSVSDLPFTSPVSIFYMTDPITRASETMAKCVEEILGHAEAAE
jgi:NADH-quinone oxidoreductase subunit G